MGTWGLVSRGVPGLGWVPILWQLGDAILAVLPQISVTCRGAGVCIFAAPHLPPALSMATCWGATSTRFVTCEQPELVAVCPSVLQLSPPSDHRITQMGHLVPSGGSRWAQPLVPPTSPPLQPPRS